MHVIMCAFLLVGKITQGRTAPFTPRLSDENFLFLFHFASIALKAIEIRQGLTPLPEAYTLWRARRARRASASGRNNFIKFILFERDMSVI